MSEKREKRKNTMDERQLLQRDKAGYNAFLVCLLFDVVLCVYYFIKKDIDGGGLYAIHAAILGIAFLFFLSHKADAEIPKSVFGHSLDLSPGRAGFFRRLKWYVLEAVFILILVSLFNLYQKGSLWEVIVSTMIVSYLAVLVMYSVIGEMRVYNWRKQLKKMDEEE